MSEREMSDGLMYFEYLARQLDEERNKTWEVQVYLRDKITNLEKEIETIEALKAELEIERLEAKKWKMRALDIEKELRVILKVACRCGGAGNPPCSVCQARRGPR